MYQPTDPYLADLRRVCLALPETVEVEAWGRPTFRAGKKIFAVFTGSEEDRYTVIFKPDAEERPALLGDDRFYSPPYWGPSGWLGLDLTAGPVDWDEVAELVETSYRHVALKRMLKTLDGSSTT
jgi:predicted DNA-binding protein (MmcQ/YjbR family)